MLHPNYMLNPGDMFSVDQTKVLWATGAPKPPSVKETPAEEEEETSETEASEALDPVTPDEAAAAPSTAAEEPLTEGNYAGKKGPEKKPWLKHNDPNNPFDPSKPYATPWRPRDYLPPFAFIPRYLEVRGHRSGDLEWNADFG